MKTILVTGSTDGIGKETARQLAQRGARVIVHGRSDDKVQAARTAISKAAPDAVIETAVADFASFAEVRALAADLKARFPDLDVLLNNAGVFASEPQRTTDGHEVSWQVNHLSPFLLTLELLGTLKARPEARVVTVASVAHTRGKIAFEDPDLSEGFEGYRAYAQSKLANVLFTQELARRLEGTQVVASCLHPGVIQTKLLRAGFRMTDAGSVSNGAATSVFLALDAAAGANANGRYFVDCHERPPATTDPALAARLWQLSEQQLGVR